MILNAELAAEILPFLEDELTAALGHGRYNRGKQRRPVAQLPCECLPGDPTTDAKDIEAPEIRYCGRS